MSERESPLPKFVNPPVVEVALSVMMEPLPNFKTAYVGLLWNELRERFPKTQDQPALDLVIEREKEHPRQLGPAVQFQAVDKPPIRTWFLNNAETDILQVQHDRIARNWRRLNAETYPSYENIREPFGTELRQVEDFITRHKLGAINPVQWEVTYVNHIKAGNGWQGHADLSDVFTQWSQQSMGFLPPIEDGRFNCRYVIRVSSVFLGRLHVSVQPAFSRDDSTPMFVLTLTARGKIGANDLKGALQFLDIGHEWIVRGFADLTTSKMHDIWRRER